MFEVVIYKDITNYLDITLEEFEKGLKDGTIKLFADVTDKEE